jgi:hypothetical protein
MMLFTTNPAHSIGTPHMVRQGTGRQTTGRHTTPQSMATYGRKTT